MVTRVSDDSNKQLIRTAFEDWAAGTGGPFRLLAADATWTIVGRSHAAGTYPTRAAFMRDVIEPFNARMEQPLVPTVRSIYADGDTVIVLFDASAVARDGRSYDNTYTWYLTMRDQQIASAVAFFDSIEFNDLWERVQPA
jgi:uncharacterized protein